MPYEVISKPINVDVHDWLVHDAKAIDVAHTLHNHGMQALSNLDWIGSQLLIYCSEYLHLVEIEAPTHDERAEQAINGTRTISHLIKENDETPLFIANQVQGVRSSDSFNGAPNDDPARQTVLISEAVDLRGLSRATSVPEYSQAMLGWEHIIFMQRHNEGLPGEWIYEGKQVCNLEDAPPDTVPAQNFILTKAIVGLSSAYEVLNSADPSEC